MTIVTHASDGQRDQISGARVVVVTYDHALAVALKQRLPAIELSECDEAAEALDGETDVLVLGLGGYDSLDVVRDVRAHSRVPVLALIDAAVDGVDALEAGSDDFVRMPCAAREIAARIVSAVRRRRWSADRDELRFGDVEIDRTAREVRVRGQALSLPALEFDLIAHLASEPRRVFTRDELLERVWHASSEWLGPATVTEHVRRVRRRLAEGGGTSNRIHTVRGKGYRFDPAPV